MSEQERMLQDILDHMAQLQGEVVALQTVVKLSIDVLSTSDSDKYGTLKHHISAIANEYKIRRGSNDSTNIDTLRLNSFIDTLSKIGENAPFDLRAAFSVIKGGKDI